MSNEFLLSGLSIAPDTVVVSRYRKALKDNDTEARSIIEQELRDRGLFRFVRRRAI